MENSQEIKNILKSAKDAIKNKEYKEALKLCKSVIDKDKENYLAWVMTGAAAQENGSREQALAALQRAVQISPNQAPAWQGLAQLHEKSNSYSDLISVYSELRKIFKTDVNKYYEFSMKYTNVLALHGKKSEAVDVLYQLLSLEKEDKDVSSIVVNLTKLLADSTVDKKSSEIYSRVIDECEKLVDPTAVDSDLKSKLNENLLVAMVKQKLDFNLILDKSLHVLNTWPQNEVALKTMIEIYHECLICGCDLGQDKLDNIKKHLAAEYMGEELAEYNKLVEELINMSKDLNQNQIVQFKLNLERIEKINNQNVKIVFTYLQNFYYSHVSNSKLTLQSSDEGLSQLPESIVESLKDFLNNLFYYNKAVAFYSNRDFKSAIENFQKTIDVGAKSLVQKSARYAFECLVRTDNKDRAMQLKKEHIVDELQSEICDLIYKIYTNERIENTYEIAKELVGKNPEDHDCNFLMAKIAYDYLNTRHGELGSEEAKTLCFQSNVKAIKLSPYKWEFIYNLGNYYKNIVKDYKKALKCFQKAYELCQNLNLCGLELVDCLLNEQEDEIAFNILKKANEEIENCKWASLRLGIIYLKKGEHNEAIRLFYNVIRNDPNDYNMWECLADAYLARGSLTAALKSFNKAIELNADSNYAFYQIAHIKQSLKLYDQAIIDYYSVLNKITNHIPTLKGLGEAYYELAKENVKNSTDHKYLGHIESSIKYLSKAICLRKDLCCLWKILGDCCSLIKNSPNVQLNITVPKLILEKNFHISDTELVEVNKFELLKLCEESYRICCKLRPEIGSYWYDLGLAYYLQYLHMITTNQAPTDKTKPVYLINKSKECLINSINLEPDNYLFWNALGVLYSKKEINKPHFAQHCFIKSIKLEDTNAITWTNFGVFYLLNGENIKAHECFKKAQAIDPEYGVAWIGQGFIAETVDIEQCIDLYRHAVELILHTEALYGYSRIVCKIFTDASYRSETIYTDYIEYLNALPLSSDCLAKYCERIIDNPDAYFLCGVLFEKLSLPLTSIKYYERVFDLIQDETNEIHILARRGYARLLCEQKQYENALMQYRKIDVKNSIEDIFALAKVFYKLTKYQQCAKIFEGALNVCSESEISIVYTAMGMAQSKYNIQEAISSFFKSFQCKVKCIQSLFALCSIGLLKKDDTLINAVFKELNVTTDVKFKFDIVKLKSIYFCLERKFDKAVKCISKYVHEYPAETRGWIELCLCLKRSKSFDLALVISNVIFKTSTQADLIFYECTQFLLLQKLKSKNYLDEDGFLLKMFQKTLHMFPAHLPSWSSFSQFLSLYESQDSTLKSISSKVDLTCSATAIEA